MSIFRLLVLLLSSSIVFAAGGSGGSEIGASTEPLKRKTPLETAVYNYNKGLKYRDKARSYQEKAAAESNPKKIAKLQKKVTKQFRKAAQRFRVAIKNEPRLYQAHGSLGYALKQLGELDRALLAYDLSLRLKPNYTPAIEYRAETTLLLGRFDETKHAYIKLMDLDRPRADMLMQAIQRWLQIPVDNNDFEAAAAFRSWADERLALSQQTLDLSGAAPLKWQTN